MAPSVKAIEEPHHLSLMFTMSIPVSVSLMLNFLYELTWYTSSKRLKVFKTEISKVLMTVVFFNLFTLMFMSWMWQLSKQIKSMQKLKESNARDQRRLYEENIQRIRKYKGLNQEVAPLKLRITLSDSEQ